jgi:hypothetical protein
LIGCVLLDHAVHQLHEMGGEDACALERDTRTPAEHVARDVAAPQVQRPARGTIGDFGVEDASMRPATPVGDRPGSTRALADVCHRHRARIGDDGSFDRTVRRTEDPDDPTFLSNRAISARLVVTERVVALAPPSDAIARTAANRRRRGFMMASWPDNSGTGMKVRRAIESCG